MSKRKREDGASLVKDASLVAHAYRSSKAQVAGSYLAVGGALDEQRCAELLPELLRRHQPQELVILSPQMCVSFSW